MRIFRAPRALIHFLAVASLIVIPSLCLAPPTFWRLTLPQLTVIGLFAFTYLVAAYLVRERATAGARSRIAQVLLVGLATFGTCFVALILWQWWRPQTFPPEFPYQALTTSLVLGFTVFVLVHVFRPGALLPLTIVTTLLLAGLAGQLAYRQRWLPRPPQPTRTVSYVDSSLYLLEVTSYAHFLPTPTRYGGGLAPWDGGYLLATGDGDLYRIDVASSGDGLTVKRLPWSVPLNLEEFKRGAREVFKDSPSKGVESSRFRVADVLVLESADGVQFFAPHHYWDPEGQCFVLRVSTLQGTPAELHDARTSLKWSTFYQTTPCLTFNTKGPRGVRFEGLENGGRMALLGDHQLLLTVGDHAVDGVNRPEMLSQDTASAYGKILRIQLDTGAAEMLSLGHRNPQGLFVDPGGTIWETEHGPRGGDELNHIRPGANYGWPLVVYGTDYSRHSWPLNSTQGRHDGFEQPVFAFIPSPGLSSLTGVTGDRFPLWRNDLLVGSLPAETIFRMRVESDRLVISEPIQVGERVRDILITNDGRILLWTDSGTLMVIAPAEAQIGDSLVTQCTACHGLSVWDRPYLGPNLAEIVGRPVASVRNFAYSEALREFGGRWTRKRLDAFLADPQSALPGTTMQFDGIEDVDQRRQLIDYLENLP